MKPFRKIDFEPPFRQAAVWWFEREHRICVLMSGHDSLMRSCAAYIISSHFSAKGNSKLHNQDVCIPQSLASAFASDNLEPFIPMPSTRAADRY